MQPDSELTASLYPMKTLRWLVPGLVVLVIVALGVNEFRPVPLLAAQQTIGTSLGEGTALPVPWPGAGQAAIGGADGGAVAASPSSQPRPIASVAKVMTALVVLDEKPLAEGARGPTITVTPDDVTEYQQEKADQQSVLAVEAGEQLTEFQALQGLLIPSGNNIASLVARWASGSVDAHVQRMNARARTMGLDSTTFADASGLSDKTVSTPSDLVRLGQEALKQPALADIVEQEQAQLPVAGTVYNVNYALGQQGIFGIKTGNTLAGGAIYLFAGNVQLPSGVKTTMVGAVQGLSTLDGAFEAARTLLRAAATSLRIVHVASKNQTVGRYTAPWGGGSDVVATEDLDLLVWSGTVVRLSLRAQPLNPPVSPRSGVGVLRVTAGDAVFALPVVNADQLYAPGRGARLTRLSW
jgi:D-alanyl-D-alanine carboxypeptidase (penicillin-binding protein 5/6)